MSDPTTITLFGPTAFILSMILIATPFISYYAQTATMYTITPKDCDATMYANESSWYTNPWVVISAYGVCPTMSSRTGGYSYSG
jgi:hypothetical protein